MLRSFRVPFLLLTPICVGLGIAAAQVGGASIGGVDIVLVLLGALAAHVSVNTLNEYQDFRSGLDLTTARTPFSSGGSGALPSAPEMAGSVLAAAWISLAVTIAVGAYFVVLRGPSLLPLGLAGVAIILSYTAWINRHPILCLVSPGLGFGPLMVMGTGIALTGDSAVPALLASLVPFFLVNNLLLFNQLPDLNADRRAGRRHFPIAFGVDASRRVYALFAAAAYLCIVVGVLARLFPPLSLLALLPGGLNVVALRAMHTDGAATAGLVPALGLNVVATLTAPSLLAITLLMG